MSRTILAPFDGSDASWSALRYARDLAPDERLVALHVVEPLVDRSDPGATDTSEARSHGRPDEAYRRAFERARDRLGEAESLAGGTGSFDAEFHYGHPLHEILLYVDRYVVDEVVMGSPGLDGSEALRLGSVVEPVVERSPAPVTVVRAGRTDGVELPASVLVPFDGSAPARNALVYAFERFPEAAVTALFADYPATGDAEHLGPGGGLRTEFEEWYGDVKRWHERADRDPEDVLHIAETVADDHGRDVRTVVDRGDPTHVVVAHAERTDVNHVVLGSHGHDGTMRRFLGSVARSVVSRSPTSVTVVR
jgi:nucleotide-binding universal stress UspA family protein